MAKLGLSVVHIGSRGLGVVHHGSNGRLESMNDYLHPLSSVSHCGDKQKLEMLIWLLVRLSCLCLCLFGGLENGKWR